MVIQKNERTQNWNEKLTKKWHRLKEKTKQRKEL